MRRSALHQSSGQANGGRANGGRANGGRANGGRASAGRGQLTTTRGAALYIGALLGPGLLLLPGLAAAEAGPASILAWLGLLGLSGLFAAVFSALGRDFPSGGGVVGYVTAGLGTRAGLITGWTFLAGVVGGAPIVCLIGASYVTELLGGGQLTRAIVAAAILLMVLALAAAGLRASSGAQLALVGLLIVVVVVAVVGTGSSERAAHWAPFAPHGWLPVGHAAATLMLSFVGWEAVAPLTTRFANPAKQLPRVVAIALAATTALYLSLAIATIGVLGLGAATSVPLADLLRRAVGPAGTVAAAVAAVILTLGATNAYINGAAAMARGLVRSRPGAGRTGPDRSGSEGTGVVATRGSVAAAGTVAVGFRAAAAGTVAAGDRAAAAGTVAAGDRAGGAETLAAGDRAGAVHVANASGRPVGSGQRVGGGQDVDGGRAGGSQAGDCQAAAPQLLVAIAAAGLLVITVYGLRLVGTDTLVMLPTVLFLAVYLGSMVAAVRLLSGRARVAAVPAALAVLVMLAYCGWALVLPAAVALAVGWHEVSARRRDRRAAAAATRPELTPAISRRRLTPAASHPGLTSAASRCGLGPATSRQSAVRVAPQPASAGSVCVVAVRCGQSAVRV